jgi:hypothetical protein
MEKERSSSDTDDDDDDDDEIAADSLNLLLLKKLDGRSTIASTAANNLKFLSTREIIQQQNLTRER